MRASLSILLAALAIVFTTSPVDARMRRGLAWGYNDNYANVIAKGMIEWYHHWQNGPVKQMPDSVEFVPMYWGPKYSSEWAARKKALDKQGDLTGRHILAFNEPDEPGQANMDPKDAAKVYMKEIQPYAKKGAKLVSPQICWDTNWFQSFIDECDKLGCQIDFIAMHWYGSWKDLSGFKKRVKTFYNKFHKRVWITEYGITSSSNPSQKDVKNFHMQATTWLATQSYVKRAAWFGCFAIGNAPDAYASSMNAFYSNGKKLRDMAYWYMYTSRASKRELGSKRSPTALLGEHAHNGPHHHRRTHHVRAEETEEGEEEEIPEDLPAKEGVVADHCDRICKLRTELDDKVDVGDLDAPDVTFADEDDD